MDSGVVEYRLNAHDRRLKEVEDAAKLVPLLTERVQNMREHMDQEFAAQGEEIKSLRRAVVGAAISIAASALLFSATIWVVFT